MSTPDAFCIPEELQIAIAFLWKVLAKTEGHFYDNILGRQGNY
jgi:hypothetical protein